jgi:EAL domain-containing protein (putative c-di-GMP-specific phosphodiesterase class I)
MRFNPRRGDGGALTIRGQASVAAMARIDKSFVDNVDTDPAAEALIAMIIEGAHRLGLTVIAEGVERDEQRRRLRTLGCDAAQGYLLGYRLRSMPQDISGHHVRVTSERLDCRREQAGPIVRKYR